MYSEYITMIPAWLPIVAGYVAFFLPFLIVLRWYGLGFVCSVLVGWGVVHWINMTVPSGPDSDPLVDAVFKGVWLIFGPVYMTIWCSFVALVVWMTTEVVTQVSRRIQRRR